MSSSTLRSPLTSQASATDPTSPLAKYRGWQVRLDETELTLQEALDALAREGDPPTSIPLVIQLLENPRYSLGRIDPFRGRVDLRSHDCIHALLARGILPLDEAFVVGFTVGSSRQVGAVQREAFCLIARTLYPRPYRFGADEVEVYRAAVDLGGRACRADLSALNFDALMTVKLGKLRAELGIQDNALREYNRWEAERFPGREESQRLLKNSVAA